MITKRTLSGTLLCIALLAVGCGSPSGPTDKPSAEPASQAPEPAQTQATAPAPAEEEQVADAPVATDTAVPADAPMAAPVPAPQTLAATPASAPVAAPAATAAKVPPAAVPATTAAAAPAAAPTPKPTPTQSAPAPAVVAAAAPAPVVPAAPPPAAPAAKSGIADPGGTVAVAATKPGLTRIGAEACGDCHDVQFESWAEGAHAKRKPPLDCEDCHGPGSEYEPKSVMKDPVKAKAAGLVMPDKAFCAKCHTQGVDDAFMEKAHAHAD